MEWARSQARPPLRSPHQQLYPERLDPDPFFPSAIRGLQAEIGFEPWDYLLEPNQTPEAMPRGPADTDLSGPLLSYDLVTPSSIIDDFEAPEDGALAESSDALASIQSLSAGSLSDILLPDFSNASDMPAQRASNLEHVSTCHQMWPAQASQTSQVYSSPWSNTAKSPQQLSDLSWMTFNQSYKRWNGPQLSLSPFSIDQQMIATSNNHLTSANLLRIYHDVLEHNLSCWLTEMTCPYYRGPRNTAAIVPEWGSSWSNRIYQRTIKLDSIAQSCKLVQLTRAQDQLASKALHLAIMAFATQWAQGSHRHREKYSSGPTYHQEVDVSDGIAEEFDRTLQFHFWDQAQRALQQAADLESFRVACAELIFGLVQRPRNPDNQFPGHTMETHGNEPTTDSVMVQVHDIIRHEGPPIYMESAARKMHALKYRWDAFKQGLGQQRGRQNKDVQDIATMSSEEQATIGLLYWLAIMFDTVSSSMNERPVVVLDEDCNLEAQKDAQQTPNMSQCLSRNRWDVELFMQGSLEETHQTHWPCSYEAAAEDITKSAPVKVLLFRHLSYLQNAIRKSAHEDQVENIVQSTMSLYRYWNRTHGAFFEKLVQNYTAVPQRIQGWFICISAHWHLGALMLADLVEFVDENAIGAEKAACGRHASQTTKRIRKHSANMLSDLARVATPPAGDVNLGAPQMPDFHHAVNEGTLLTEPWTLILIRAFTKASMVFLNDAEDSIRHATSVLGHNSYDFEWISKQAEDCIKGLWLLGKKSDMARSIAEILLLALRNLQSMSSI